MRINVGLLFNLFIATIAGEALAKQTREQLIVATPNNYNVLSHFDDLPQRDHKVLWKGPLRTYHMLNVTDEEAQRLSDNLKIITGDVDGVTAQNSEISVSNLRRNTAAISQYLDSIPRCKNVISNTTMKYLAFIMDGYINNNGTVLSGMPIKKQYNLMGATPGVLTHGSIVTETLLGGNDNFIQASGIEAIGLTVFGDNGRGFVGILLQAIGIIDKLRVQLQKQGYELGATFSGNSAYISILDKAFAELSQLMFVTVAAGNGHAPCNTVSPPYAGKNVMGIGGYNIVNGSPVPNYSSNWDCGPNMFYTPYCANTHKFIGNSIGSFCGTSESTPNFHRLLAHYAAACPTCTQEQVINLLHRFSVQIPTSVVPISVFPTTNVCPLDQTLFDSYKTTPAGFSTNYNGTTNDNKFCVTFSVKPKTGDSNLLLKVNDGTKITINSSNQQVKTAVRKNGKATFVVAAQNKATGPNILHVYIQTQTGFTPVAKTTAKQEVETIALGSTKGSMVVSKARVCLLA